MPQFMLSAAVSLVFSIIFIVAVLGRFNIHTLFTISIIAVILLRMLCLGGADCLYLMKAKGKSFGKMYAADLIGAFVGAVIIVPLLKFFPVPHLIAALGMVIALVLIFNARKLLIPASLLII